MYTADLTNIILTFDGQNDFNYTRPKVDVLYIVFTSNRRTPTTQFTERDTG